MPFKHSTNTHALKKNGPAECHYQQIPLFVLRRYQVDAGRHKVQDAAARAHDYIYIYNTASRTLDTRSIAEVHGGFNRLGRDASDAYNAEHLEDKLSQLEQHASRMTQRIHDSISLGELTLTRASMGSLRKYLFLANLRPQVCAESPAISHVSSREQLKEYGRTQGLRTPTDIWLHFMQYILDTPHDEIDAVGAAWLHDDRSMNQVLSAPDLDDPNIVENFEAIVYQQQSLMYYVGIWEAAETDEFVLTPDVFGFWEGCLVSHPDFPLHRVFVISPRLAIVLRANFMRGVAMLDGQFRASSRSDLAGLPLEGPTATYDGDPVDVDARAQEAQMNSFSVKITKLSPEQTLAVNAVALQRTHRNAPLTYTSKTMMVRTIRDYLRRATARDYPNKDSYTALVEQLVRRSPVASTRTTNSPAVVSTSPAVKEPWLLPEYSDFRWLMSIVLLSIRPTSPVPLYECGEGVVHHMSHCVCAAHADRDSTIHAGCGSYGHVNDTEFTKLFAHYTEALAAYVRSHSPRGKLSDYDLKAVVRPPWLGERSYNNLTDAARPLLEAAIPDCVCSEKSSQADRVLEAGVIVKLLDQAVEDARFRAGMRKACPDLSAFLMPHNPRQRNLPPHPEVRALLDDLVEKMLSGEVQFPNDYEVGRALHAYCVVMQNSPSMDGQVTETFERMLPIISHRLQEVSSPPPGFVPRPLLRPRRRLDHEAADVIMKATLYLIGTLGYRMMDEDKPHPDVRKGKVRQWTNHLIVYGFLDWLAKNRHDVLETMVGSKHFATFVEEDEL